MTQIVDTLAKFGTGFQTKCIVALLNDRPFVEQSLDVLNADYFESDANRWIAERIIWYFSTYKAVPTIEVLKKESDKLPEGQANLKLSVVESLKDIFYVQKSQPDDLKYIKDELLTFCKNQAIKGAVLTSADLLATGKYDQIKAIIDKALHAGVERNIGHNWLEDIELRVSKTSRNTVLTPWDIINQITDGGLGAGELGCVIAPSGIGKSWLLSAIGNAAIKNGKRVAHYTFELAETYVGLRYDTINTGIEPNEIKNNVALVKQAMKGVTGQLYIKYYPTRSITANAIMAHIQRMIMLGQKPDLIIIDYADLMRAAAKSDARHEELGYIYEEIRGMLGELGIPGWTASQSQRSSLQDDVIEADKIAGAYSKIMAADFVMSASRKVADKMTNTARIHIIKNRFGPDGQTFPAEMDLAHGRLNIYDDNSPEGMLIKQRLQSGEGMLKSVLSRKLLDMHKPDQTI